MSAPRLVFVGPTMSAIESSTTALTRTCALPECGQTFTVRYPSERKRFCGYSCSNRATRRAAPVDGPRNGNWAGGKSTHPLYATYLEMIARCTRHTHKRYASYGGRGIAVCDRWLADFWTFVADMGDRPVGLTLDRRDNDGPYSLTNCRWASVSEQNQNRRPAAYAGVVNDPATGRFIAACAPPTFQLSHFPSEVQA